MQARLKLGTRSRRLALVALVVALMALPGSAIIAEHGASSPAAPHALTAAQLKAAPLVHAGQTPVSMLGSATDVGQLAPSTPLYFTVSFDLSNPAALANLIQLQQEPGSPLYRQFLTQQAFDQEYGPSPLLDTEATSYFTSYGMASVPTGSPLVLGFRASASEVDAAFHSQIDQYETSGGSVQYTNSQPLSLPAPLADALSAVNGLSSFPEMQPTFMGAPGTPSGAFSAAISAAPPQGDMSQAVNWSNPAYLYAPEGSAAAFGSTPIEFMNPSTMTVAYNATGLYALGDLGQGSTIAVVMAQGYNPSDLATFSNETFGNPDQLLDRLTAYPVAGSAANASAPGSVFWTGGDSFEFSLDLEYSSTMAPRAHIDAVYGPSLDTASLVSDYATVASIKPVPNVVTNSWGGPEDVGWNLMGPSWQGEGAIENELEELAALGSTVLFSSADSAGFDSYTGLLSASFGASSPYATSVGGLRTNVGNATYDAFPAPAFTVTTTVAVVADSQAGSGSLWFPDSTLDGVYAKTLTNQSYWYTTQPNAPPSEPPYAGGGIGLSEWFTQPGWQHGFTVSDSGRYMTADISAEADFNETVYFAAGWNYYWGGTSFACPTVAGEMALIDTYLNQTIHAAPHQPFYTGLINPLLYDIANDMNFTNQPYDQITYGSNNFAVLAAAEGLSWPGAQNWPDAATGVTAGWNLLSGWGAPNVGVLATDAATLLGLTYYVAFTNNTAAHEAVTNTSYTFVAQTITGHTPAADAPYQLWFSAAGLNMGAPVETTGTTNSYGNISFETSTPGFLEIYVQVAGEQVYQSIWFSPAPLTSGTLSIVVTDGTPTSMMGGFDAFSIFYTGAYPWEYPAAGPVIPNSIVVQVTYKATPSSTAVPIYNAQILGVTNYTGYWDSPPYIENPEFNESLLAPTLNTSLTLTNLDGISYVPTWNVPVPETYTLTASYLGLTAATTYQVTPQANVEGVGPVETYLSQLYAGPGYIGYSANNTVVAPVIAGEGTYPLPVSFTNWEGQPLVGATVDIALPPVLGPPYLSTPIPGTTEVTNATGIAVFSINETLSLYAEEIGFLAIQVYNSSYAPAYVPSLTSIGETPLWLDDSEGLLVLFTPPAEMSTTFYADEGAVQSNYVGTEGAIAAFSVSAPGAVLTAFNNITSLTYSLGSAAPTSVPLGTTGQSQYSWGVYLPTLAIGAHTFTVTFTDSQGFTYTNTQTFWAIGSGPFPTPVVAVTAPTPGSYLSGTVNVGWTIDEAAEYLTSVTLAVVSGGVSVTYNVTGLSTFPVPVASLATGAVSFYVNATNQLGNTGTSSVSAFAANTPLSAVITSPANRATFAAGTDVTVGLAWAGSFLSKETLVWTGPNGSPQTVTLTSNSYTLADVTVGEYKLTLNVTSLSGQSAVDTLTFNVTSSITPPPVVTTGVSTTDVALITVAALVIGAIVGVLIGRSGRKPAPAGTPPGATGGPNPPNQSS